MGTEDKTQSEQNRTETKSNNTISKERLIEILGCKIVEVLNKTIDSCDKNLSITNQFRLDAMKAEAETKKIIFYIYLFLIFGICALFIILAIVSVFHDKDEFVLPIVTGVFGFIGGIFVNKQGSK